jgi:hypothetical protein
MEDENDRREVTVAVVIDDDEDDGAIINGRGDVVYGLFVAKCVYAVVVAFLPRTSTDLERIAALAEAVGARGAIVFCCCSS